MTFEDIRHKFNRLTFYTLLLAFLSISMTFIIFSTVAQPTLTCLAGQFVNIIGTASDSCATPSVQLGKWSSFPCGQADCSNINGITGKSCAASTQADPCELFNSIAYRGVFIPAANTQYTTDFQLDCSTPATPTPTGSVLYMQYANYSVTTYLNTTNFLKIGQAVYVDNTNGWPCPGDLISNPPAPLPSSCGAPPCGFIFRIFGACGCSMNNAGNPVLNNVLIDVYLNLNRVVASLREIAVTTTGFRFVGTSSIVASAAIPVDVQWIATNSTSGTCGIVGSLTDSCVQSGVTSGACSIAIGFSTCTSSTITFPTVFTGTVHVTATPITSIFQGAVSTTSVIALFSTHVLQA